MTKITAFPAMSLPPNPLAPPITIGGKLHELLKATGRNQNQLAIALGKSRQWVGMIASDEKVPNEETMRKIATYLKVPSDTLVNVAEEYQSWLETPQGIEHQAATHQSKTRNDLIMQGVGPVEHDVIQRACEAGLFTIVRIQEGIRSPPVFDEVNRYAIKCHFECVCDQPKGMQNILRKDEVQCIRTQERFNLARLGMIYFNGIADHLRMTRIHGFRDSLVPCEDEQPLLITFDNFSGDDFTFQVGDEIASVYVWMKP